MKPRRLPRHRQARLRFARHHRRWNRAQWSKVLFTDESRICLRWVDGRQRVWRRRGEELDEDCIQEVEAFGGGSIMVWGGISAEGQTDILTIRGGLTGQRYVDEVLRPEVLPYAAAIGDGFILMDDNATPHRARVTQDFLETEGIENMDWPPKSPDMNPIIELLWDVLKRKVDRKVNEDTTLADLERHIRHAWRRIPQQKIQNLVHSMRRRVLAVIDKNGGHTRY